MRKISALLTVATAFALTACAQNVASVQDRLDPLVRQAIAEKRTLNDLQFQRWRDYQRLTELAGCNLSKGSIERNATESERAILDALDCG